MQLSEQATQELKEILQTDLGEGFSLLSESDIQNIGELVLVTTATALKIKARQ